MNDIDLIIYNEIYKKQQEIQTDNRIQLEIPMHYNDRADENKRKEKQEEPRRVIIIDL